MRRRLWPVVCAALFWAGCGTSSTPTPITPTPATPAPPPESAPPVVVSGRIAGTVTATPLPGVNIDFGGRQATADGAGAFRFEYSAGALPPVVSVRLAGPNILERSFSVLLPGGRDLALDAIALDSGFDLDYYRRLVRDNFTSSTTLRPLRRWTQPPRLYIRTIDEAGTPIEAATLDPVVAAFQDEILAWTGGRFGFAAVELGTGSREGVSGWITVKWPAPLTDSTYCGRAQVAVSGGWIELNYLMNAGCSCRGSRIGNKTVRHELGHAMGFYHTGELTDLMWNQAVCEDRRPTARERLHAAIAYSRSVGNTDPDVEPGSVSFGSTAAVVVVD